MIPFELQPEPANFDERCRKRGRKWLEEHPGYRRPRDYWTEFEPQLREAFRGLCAYCAMWIPTGQTDHFRPINELKDTGQDELAYEWSNFRYCSDQLNKKKGANRVLDPFEVQDGWFEIRLPSLQLVMTEAVPEEYRELAEYTLKKLELINDVDVIRIRTEWYELYLQGLPLDELDRKAPLVARAVRADLGRGVDWKAKGF